MKINILNNKFFIFLLAMMTKDLNATTYLKNFKMLMNGTRQSTKKIRNVYCLTKT